MEENKPTSESTTNVKVTEKPDGLEMKLTDDELQDLKDQVVEEHKIASDFLEPRISMWLKRLKLYNNQKRDQTAVGDPLLFTHLNALLASLYDDRMTIIWSARERGDQKVEEGLNVCSEYDYDAMDKPTLDYDWIWDVLFFSYGLVNFTEFDRKLKVPIPELIDPASFLFDPKASSLDGNKWGVGGMRFCGREIMLTKNQMDRMGVYSNIDDVKTPVSATDLSAEAAQSRQEAQGGQADSSFGESTKGESKQYKLLEWRTWFKGERVLTVFSNDISTLNRIKKMDKKGWEIIDKRIFPISHQFQGVSIPDLTEDKQRKRSVVSNLAVRTLQADLYPMYTYDSSKVKNRGDLVFGFNKFIPIEGVTTGAIVPINKFRPNMQLFEYIMNNLDVSAQKATATPELQQGMISREQRTLGELNLVAQRVDTRYSLAVKNLMVGEKKFWQQWYALYKKHFKKGIDKKILRLSGTTSDNFREFTRENLISEIDPDVRIESRILEEARKMKQLARYTQVLSFASADPSSNRRFGFKRFAYLSGLTADEVDQLYPPTLDEMMAREQNDELSKDKQVPVLPTDNHQVHLEVHSEAADTDATYGHIETHKMAMLLQRERPDLFPQQQMMTDEGAAATGQEGTQPGQATQQGMPVQRNPEQNQMQAETTRPSVEASKQVAMNG